MRARTGSTSFDLRLVVGVRASGSKTKARYAGGIRLNQMSVCMCVCGRWRWYKHLHLPTAWSMLAATAAYLYRWQLLNTGTHTLTYIFLFSAASALDIVVDSSLAAVHIMNSCCCSP